MHLDDEGVHLCEHFLGLVHDEIRTFGNDVEFVISDERGNLDDHIHLGIKTGHLKVEPDEHRSTLRRCLVVSWGGFASPRAHRAT